MFHFPWISAAIVVVLAGSAWASRQRRAETVCKGCILVSAVALFCSLMAWWEFSFNGNIQAETGGPLAQWRGSGVLEMDGLSAPLIPLAALLYLLTFTVTLRTKLRRFSFTWALISEAILLATFATSSVWPLVTLLVVGTIPPYLELRARHKLTRVYVLYMTAFAALLIVGCAMANTGHHNEPLSGWFLAPLMLAILIRGGVAPLHSWVADLFEHATFGTSLLFVAPMVGAYAAVRLLLPVAPDSVLQGIGIVSLGSAFYAAGMALIQKEARRFFCYLFLSHSSLVFLGLESSSLLGLTGGLCVWLSIGLALSGLGLTLRSLESRHGRLSLVRHQGLYDHTPALAICFLLTGLASVGFPCTFGFIGMEMLVDGAVHTYPYVGVIVVVVAALNGIAVIQTYFRLFTGCQYHSTVPLGMGIRERWAVLGLAVLIFAGGLFPQWSVASRYQAAESLLNARAAEFGSPAPVHAWFASPVLEAPLDRSRD
ncbi:MAG: proton-conducting transporter membrane subunit [Planctomycetota bacterium]|nr:proton-conducting transporter membrane subunit [Planctomycetota bacterium]